MLPCQAGDIIVPNNAGSASFLRVTVVYRHYVVLNIEELLPVGEYFPILSINTVCSEDGEERVFKVRDDQFDFYFRKVNQDD